MAHAGLGALLVRHWYRVPRSALSSALLPLAWLYRGLRRVHRAMSRQAPRPAGLPPVVVVGNLVVGGAGKTPTVIALVQALREGGYRPGVISRGYGRRTDDCRAVTPASAADEVGDEPLLIHRRTGAPTWVARRRLDAARSLLQAHPDVDLLLCDDGLQHAALPRDAEVIVFDERGVGNGALLPAGPLREPMAAKAPAHALVLYNHCQPTTPWAGHRARRALGLAVPLADWLGGRAPGLPLAALRGRPLIAMAGLAVPQRFFAMLGDAGLTFTPLPLPDHHRYETAPWPAGTAEIVTTEKDGVKLGAWADRGPRIWVLPLDLQLPNEFIAALRARLAAAAPAPAA